MDRSEVTTKASDRLYNASYKLSALGELFLSMNVEAGNALLSENGKDGIGWILSEIADSLREIGDTIETIG